MERSRRPPPPTRATVLRRRAVAAAVLLLAVVALATLMTRGGGDPRDSRAQHPAKPASPAGSRGLPALAAQRAAIERLRRTGLPVYCGGRRGNLVALTFDDGPSEFSARVLEELTRGGARATFFLTGRHVPGSAPIARHMLQAGAVGTHTWSHSDITRLKPSELDFEVTGARDALLEVTGIRVTLFRPPYGARDPRTDARVAETGLLSVLWDADTRDSAGASTEEIARLGIAGLRPGGIVLMHETYERTVRALPLILATARRRRMRMVTIPELLALDPPPDQVLRAGKSGCAD